MLLRGSKEDCEELVNWLNSLHPGVIKFKYEFSTKLVEFLDLKLLKENGRIKTNLFIQPSVPGFFSLFTLNFKIRSSANCLCVGTSLMNEY